MCYLYLIGSITKDNLAAHLQNLDVDINKKHGKHDVFGNVPALLAKFVNQKYIIKQRVPGTSQEEYTHGPRVFAEISEQAMLEYIYCEVLGKKQVDQFQLQTLEIKQRARVEKHHQEQAQAQSNQAKKRNNRRG